MRAQSRILALVLVLILVFPVCISAQDEAAPLSLSDNKYYNMLTSFGIINEADAIDGAEYITRSQFAKLALSLFGPNALSSVAEGAELPFEDIDGDSNSEYIVELYNRGLISGTAPGQFSPDSEVTMGQAAKVFVTALGYEKLAEKRGGFPTGYVTVAGRLDILDGVSAEVTKPIGTAAFVRMLFNALNTDVMQLEAVIEDEDEYLELTNAYKGESVLRKYYDIYKYEGVIDSNEYTSLNGATDISEGRVSINNHTFEMGATDAYKLLGYSVECFYTKSSEQVPTLLYAGIDERRNEVYITDGREVNDGALTLERFSYRDVEKNRNQDLSLSAVVVLIHNGKQRELDTALLHPHNGDVTLIDNNNDRKIDVILVNEYQTMMVVAKSGATCVLAGKEGDALALEKDAREYGFLIQMDGKEISFDEIPENSVISYTKPSDLSQRYLKQVFVSIVKIQGKVEALDTDGYEASINGESYKYSPALNIKAGDRGIFYLDFRGNIVHREEEKDFVYGYLYKMGKMKGGLSSTYGAIILSEKGNWVELEFDKKVKSGTAKVDAESFNTTYGSRINEIIRYSVTDEGKIREMHFAQSADGFSDAHMELIEREKFHSMTALSDVEFYSSAATFEGLVGLSANTVVFMLPPDYDGVNNKEAIQVVTKSEFRNNTDYPYVLAYDVDKAGVAKVAMIENTAEYSASSGLVPVKSVVGCHNADGEEVYGIRGYFSGGEIMTVCVKNDNTLDTLATSLKGGDIIRCSINKNNEIISMEKLFSNTSIGTKNWAGSASSRLVSGDVVSIDYTQKKMVVDSTNGKNMFSAESVGSIWIYDTEDKEFRVGAITDIQKGDFLYMRAGSFVIREIIVYK